MLAGPCMALALQSREGQPLTDYIVHSLSSSSVIIYRDLTDSPLVVSMSRGCSGFTSPAYPRAEPARALYYIYIYYYYSRQHQLSDRVQS